MISISVMMRDLSSISKFDYALHCIYLFLFILPNVNEISKPSFLPLLLLLFSPLTVELVSSFFLLFILCVFVRTCSYCCFLSYFVYDVFLYILKYIIYSACYKRFWINRIYSFLILFSKQKEFKHVVVLVDPIQQMHLTLFLGLRLVLVHHTLVLFDDLHHL